MAASSEELQSPVRPEVRMHAAIYVRKSTAQTGMNEDARSVERQKARAREYAAGRGWSVLHEHIYEDDGISGAEFDRRPGFNAC